PLLQKVSKLLESGKEPVVVVALWIIVWELQGDARFEEPLLRVDDVRFGDQDAEALLRRDPLACRLRVGPVAGLARPEKVIQVLAVEAVSFRLQIVADLAFDRFTHVRFTPIAPPG